MLRRIKHINREFQKQRPLQKHRHPLVQLRRERNQNTRALQPALIRGPIISLLVSFLRPGALLQRQARHEHEQQRQEEGAEDGRVEGCVRPSRHVVVGSGRDGDGEHAELDDHFAEVIGVSAQREEAYVAHGAVVLVSAAEAVLLDVGDALHDEAHGEEDDARNVPSGTEGGLGELRDVGRVKDCNWQRTYPDPEHLARGL